MKRCCVYENILCLTVSRMSSLSQLFKVKVSVTGTAFVASNTPVVKGLDYVSSGCKKVFLYWSDRYWSSLGHELDKSPLEENRQGCKGDISENHLRKDHRIELNKLDDRIVGVKQKVFIDGYRNLKKYWQPIIRSIIGNNGLLLECCIGNYEYIVKHNYKNKGVSNELLEVTKNLGLLISDSVERIVNLFLSRDLESPWLSTTRYWDTLKLVGMDTVWFKITKICWMQKLKLYHVKYG